MTISYKSMTATVNGKVVRQGEKEEGEETRYSWWTANDADVAQQVLATVKKIQNSQGNRVEQLNSSAMLYGSSQLMSFLGRFGMGKVSGGTTSSARITYNLIQSCIDTLVSKTAKNKVTPTFCTSGGIWEIQSKADKLNQFIEGIFYATSAHSMGVQAFRDACVFGDGFLHVYEDDGEVAVERVLPHELFVDPLEAALAKPSQLHRVKTIERGALLALVGEDDKELIAKVESLHSATEKDLGSGTVSDLVTVIESWRLPTSRRAKNGRHTITAGDIELVSEVYEKTWFPFVQITWSKALAGFFGQSLASQLSPIQLEINKLLFLVQRSMHLAGTFKILVKIGSKIVSQQLNNELGTVINFNDVPPQYITPPMVQPEIYSHIQTLISLGYRQAGISEMTSQGQKPMGVNSGKAMRTLTDIEGDRFLMTEQGMENFYLELGRQCIEKAKDIYKAKKSYSVTFPTGNFVETIDWKNIKLKESDYVLRCFPVSSLSKDMAGRLEDIAEYMQAGLVSPRQGRRLMAMPDLEMSDKLANASEDLLCKIIEAMLTGGDYVAPESFMDLGLAKTLALEYLNYATLHNCPQENLDKLHQFNAQIDDLTGASAPVSAAPAAPAGAAPATPQANPQPTPTSELIPNVHQ